jgi:hypothetical protein
MLEARDAGAGHGKGANRDTPEGLPPSSAGASNRSPSRAGAGNLTSLKHIIEKYRGEAPLRRGRRIDDMGERLASIANGDDEGAYPFILVLDDRACRDEGNLVDAKSLGLRQA